MKVTNQTNVQNNVQNRNISGDLNKNDFLKILVAQMRFQDPLSPNNDREFMAQMAQFSALEQMVNLNNNFSSLAHTLALGFDSVNAFSLIGKIVEIQLNNQEQFTGTVDRVLQRNGEFLVEVNNELYTLSQIISVSREESALKGGQ